MATNFKQKQAPIFSCEICDYSTCRKCNWNTHLLTAKHMMATFSNFQQPVLGATYNCEKCLKSYKDKSGLWRHKKKCDISNFASSSKFASSTNSTNNINDDIVVELIKQNQEFKQLLVEQNKQMIEMVSKPNSIVNNTLNNNFNLNFFLNETCKDAMNLTDFINSLTLSLKDLENTGKLGYEAGISQIFMNGLKELAIDKRPIHCTDLKREKLHIRDKNIWGKDVQQEQFKKSIRKVANKNMNQLTDWINTYPESQNYNSKKNDEYLNIVLQATGGKTSDEEEKHICKVVTNIAKFVEIDKSIL